LGNVTKMLGPCEYCTQATLLDMLSDLIHIDSNETLAGHSVMDEQVLLWAAAVFVTYLISSIIHVFCSHPIIHFFFIYLIPLLDPQSQSMMCSCSHLTRWISMAASLTWTDPSLTPWLLPNGWQRIHVPRLTPSALHP